MERTMGFEIVVIAILIFAAVTVWKGVRIVPQGEEWIVERLGKFNAVLNPGLTTIIPYLLGEKYSRALDKLAASDNSKIVLLPADLQETLRGILGKARSA